MSQGQGLRYKDITKSAVAPPRKHVVASFIDWRAADTYITGSIGLTTLHYPLTNLSLTTHNHLQSYDMAQIFARASRVAGGIRTVDYERDHTGRYYGVDTTGSTLGLYLV